jgi:hypothetical protein
LLLAGYLFMTINSEQFQEICNGLWRDRAMLLKGRGFLSGEAALMRAVYWRLFKAGIKPIPGAENYGFPHTASSYELGVSCMLEIYGYPRLMVLSTSTSLCNTMRRN